MEPLPSVSMEFRMAATSWSVMLLSFSPLLISSTDSTPSLFLSSFWNSLPMRMISVSFIWLAMKVRTTFLKRLLL